MSGDRERECEPLIARPASGGQKPPIVVNAVPFEEPRNPEPVPQTYPNGNAVRVTNNHPVRYIVGEGIIFHMKYYKSLLHDFFNQMVDVILWKEKFTDHDEEINN